ncbi:MAG TPA: LLM class flavin-dependent oxidoreductase [Actinomycetota bacterium]|nr:LLM class flavin-dependent oxidoreductase [Actinomycetota bacterium]
MRIGLVLPMEAPAGDPERSAPALLALAEHAEAIGLDSVWVCDHFFSNEPGAPRQGIHEAWTIVSAIAARTRRVEIGTLVMCVSYRPPGMLAKMASTADAVSGGRVILGVGAGWNEEEYRAFGYPFDRRVDRFEEALRVIGPLVRGELVTFTGRHHAVDDAELLPLDGPIPLLVAADGPRMLQLTARHADAWNTAWFGMPDDLLRRQLVAMDAALDAEGRDRSTLRRTVGVNVDEPDPTEQSVDLDDVPRAVEAYTALGVDDMLLLLGGGRANERTLDLLAAILHLPVR